MRIKSKFNIISILILSVILFMIISFNVLLNKLNEYQETLSSDQEMLDNYVEIKVLFLKLLKTYYTILDYKSDENLIKYEEAKNSLIYLLNYLKIIRANQLNISLFELNKMNDEETIGLLKIENLSSELCSKIDKIVYTQSIINHHNVSKDIEYIYEKEIYPLILFALNLEKNEVSFANEKVNVFLTSIKKSVIFYSILVFIFILYFILTLKRSILDRIHEIVNTISKYKNGDYEAKNLIISENDELTEVSSTLNSMAEMILMNQRQLISSAKMSALGEMAGGIAHEINNPLAIIDVRSRHIQNVLTKEVPDIEKAIEFAKIIESTTHRTATIVNGLRMFSRSGENDSKMIFSLKNVLLDTIMLCSDKFNASSVEIIVDSSMEDFKIFGVPVQISQVFLNLFNNANDAIEKLEQKWIKIDFEKKDQNVHIRVTDSGKGIPKEIQEKVMLPFFTTKPIGKGTGLGLSVSRGIIESHCGKLIIDNSSENTCFVIMLPIVNN